MNVNLEHALNGDGARMRPRRLVNARVLSKHLGMSLTSVYDNTRLGRLPGAIRIGRRIVYDLDKIDPWLDAGGDFASEKA